MKKFAAILIAVLYTAITSGFTVSIHYCMGKLASVKLQTAPPDACGACGKKDKSNKCCKDEVKFCKVTVSHEAAKAQASVTAAAKDLQLPVATLAAAPGIPTTPAFIAYYHHAPPEPPSIPLYKRHCIFLI